jgi:hypothetical protein
VICQESIAPGPRRMFVLAKFIQALGIADVGYALYVGLTEEHGMGRELQLMLLGFAVFYLGRFLERRATPQR